MSRACAPTRNRSHLLLRLARAITAGGHQRTWRSARLPGSLLELKGVFGNCEASSSVPRRGSSTAPGATAQSSDPASLHWSVPTTLPPSARVAVLSGDPRGPGESTLLISMPNGYRIPPHFHPSYEHIEVRKGTLLVGMGDTLDPKHTGALAAGDSATAAAGMHHFWIASGRTEVSVTFNGPYTITYLRAEDAPHRRNFPFGY
jgi:quercetin dioxygenase-like cupin family protein